ncbi:MAG: MOSC domain-containing protein [Arcobacteraceae bacterium]|nr:MOSC domain-containing protein [Arcobacteraceae bacterium]
MSKTVCEVLYVKVGKVKTTPLENSARKELVTGMKKQPVEHAYLTKTGFDSDAQADLEHHGGENKALFSIDTKTYETINTLCQTDFAYDEVAHFGENLILSNITQKEVCVGDIYSIGEAIVQVTQPRQPCWKLSASTKVKKITAVIFQHGLTGWYCKVLQEGNITQNDTMALKQRAYPNLNIELLNQLIINPLVNEEVTLEALSCEELGKPFKESLQKRYDSKGEDEQFAYQE